MGEQTFFTLGEAAKAVGRSKGTISKAVSSGRLSVHEKTANGYRIAAVELFRVFPVQRPETRRNEQAETPEGNAGNAALEREIATLREERERERATLQAVIDDLRRRLDAEAEERRKLTALLTDQRPRRGIMAGILELFRGRQRHEG